MENKIKRKKYWSQPLRVENPELIHLSTSRCSRSALWFVNNPELEERIYAFLAKYVEKYGVELYAFELIGNHYHMEASFPNSNAASFFRDFNARVAESVRLLVDEFDSGHLFQRRYSIQAIPDFTSVEDRFFYCALQPVSHGLCSKISEYPGYNFFNDAVRGIERSYKYFAYGEYNQAKKKNPKVARKDYWREHKLSFKRLPQYEDLSQEEYADMMHKKLEERRLKILEESEAKFRTKSELKRVKPGSLPKKTKKGTRRPLVLTNDMSVYREYLEWYFDKVEKFREACEKYRLGDFTVIFPPGMYRPPGLAIY